MVKVKSLTNRSGFFQTGLRRCRDQGADLGAGKGGLDVARLLEREHADRHVLVTTMGKGLRVHHPEVLVEAALVRRVPEELRIAVLARILVVQAVDVGGLENDLSLDLARPECRGVVGRAVRITRTAGQDDDVAALQMADRLLVQEGLRRSGRDQSGHESALESADPREQIVQDDAVLDGCEHAKLVGGNAIHTLGGAGGAAEDVPAADHDGDLDRLLVRGGDFLGDPEHGVGIVGKDGGLLVRSEQGFTGKLEQDTPLAHGFSS